MVDPPDAAPPRELLEIRSYHAHIYYEAASRDKAECLRHRIAERFLVRIGNWHDAPVGPHPRLMFQIAFATEVFPHLVHALWMGGVLEVDASGLSESLTAQGRSHAEVVPNTQPRG